MDVLLAILVIVLLTFLEAIFVAAEIALVTIRRTRLQQLSDEGSRAARRTQRLVATPARFLAVVQLGVTFVGFLASAFAAVTLTVALTGLLEQVPALAGSAQPIALLVVTGLLALFTIVFGELVPKSLALAHTEGFALGLSPFIDFTQWLLSPIVWLLTTVTGAVTRLLGAGELSQQAMTTEELKLIVERTGEQGVLEAEEEQMISAVIELGESRVHEVMVPRIDIVALPAGAGVAEAVDLILAEGHSRIPVYEDSVDNIIGILYAKDLLPILHRQEPPPALRSILRPPLFVPESMSIDDLLHELQRRKVHLAIVLDEYGGTAGLVTIEDLLEEIVGEIQDEYDTEEPMVVRLSDDEARVDGRADVDDLVELFDVRLDEEDQEQYDTVGGLVYHHIGGVPRVGDQVELDGATLTVESTDGRRVGKVLAVRQPRDASRNGSEPDD
ncbi:MAG TPA: hemolysin family protein [Candidatus Dormibacteraeota bacterium]|nr:hemolysin family protein [Candidatus Dormibacteraeota bacterium]